MKVEQQTDALGRGFHCIATQSFASRTRNILVGGWMRLNSQYGTRALCPGFALLAHADGAGTFAELMGFSAHRSTRHWRTVIMPDLPGHTCNSQKLDFT